MKKITVLFLMLMVFGLSAAFAQANNDTIVMVKAFGGHKFEKSGVDLTINQMRDIVKDYPDALKEMRLAKTNEVIDYVFAYSGGFCIGWALGSAITGYGEETSLYTAGIGIGLVAIGFGFGALADGHAVKAATIYNAHLGDKSKAECVNLGFGFTPSGIGLTLRF